MRYKMELEKRESAGLWRDGASSDAGRDHLGTRAASKHWAERSPLSDHHHLHHHVGSELSGPRRWPPRCSPHGAQLHTLPTLACWSWEKPELKPETGVSGDGHSWITSPAALRAGPFTLSLKKGAQTLNRRDQK